MSDVPLLYHVEKLLDERDKRYKDRFDSQEKALAVAATNSDKWQANANEWRKAMDDRERNFVSKSTGMIALIFNVVIGMIAVGLSILTYLKAG